MTQLNCKTCCVKGEDDALRKSSLSIQKIFFSSLCNTCYEPLPFKMRRRLPSTAFAAFRKSSILVMFQGARKSSLIHCEAKALLCPSTTPAGRQGFLAALALQLRSHPSALQKVCCTEKFHQSSDLKYALPICITVQSLLIFTVKTYYIVAQA